MSDFAPKPVEAPLFPVAETQITIPEFQPASVEDNENQILKKNIDVFNLRLNMTMALIGKATSFNQMVTLLGEMDKLIKQRCDMHRVQYGAPQSVGPQSRTVFPID